MKKILFIIAGLVLLGEIVWAVQSLEFFSPKQTANTSSSPSPQTSAVISLSADKTSLRIGETAAVTINVSTTVSTDGVDLIVKYDPKILAVVPSSSQSAVNVGTIYSNYPINSIDETAGQIVVSGIAPLQKAVVPNGILGTMVFQAKSVGQTSIAVDFTQGSTTDSNIIETKTAKDVLSKVENVKLTITP